jgi:hypothetical protein
VTSGREPIRAQGQPTPTLPDGVSEDPVVVALAQLVRDRWAAEQAGRNQPLTGPTNIRTITTRSSPHDEDPADEPTCRTG